MLRASMGSDVFDDSGTICEGVRLHSEFLQHGDK
jgi:hypothetical protein